MIPKNEIWQNSGYFLQPEVMCNYDHIKVIEKDAHAFVSYDREGRCYYWACIDVWVTVMSERICVGTISTCVDMTSQSNSHSNRRAGMEKFLESCLGVTDNAGQLKDIFNLADYVQDYRKAVIVLGKTTVLNDTSIYCPGEIVIPEAFYNSRGLLHQLFDWIDGEMNVKVYTGNVLIDSTAISMRAGKGFNNAIPKL